MAPSVARVQETVAVVLLNLVVNFILALHTAITKGGPALIRGARERGEAPPFRAQQLKAWLADAAAAVQASERLGAGEGGGIRRRRRLCKGWMRNWWRLWGTSSVP